MSVVPDFRRRGIGNQLLQRVLKFLKEEGIYKVALLAFKQNARGNDFWKEHAFTLREDVHYYDKVLLEQKRLDI